MSCDYIVTHNGSDVAYFTPESDGASRLYRARNFAREESLRMAGPFVVLIASDVYQGPRAFVRKYESGEDITS